MNTVIFAHGRDSGPWGTKIRTLARIAEKFDCRVLSQDDYGNYDPEKRVLHMIETVKKVSGQIILVGSSMGAYVVTQASQSLNAKGLFLMAPAFGMPGYASLSPKTPVKHIEIVMGWEDKVIPANAVFSFARSHNAPLHILPAGHSLLDQLTELEDIFTHFLTRCGTLTPVAGNFARSVACL